MSYAVRMDSAGEINDFLKGKVEGVPLILNANGKEYTDDENIDTDALRCDIRACKTAPKSACPAPEKFFENINEADRIYIVTISSHLSGSFNSARLGADMYSEAHPETKIHVFDSKSAGGGEALISEMIIDLEEKGFSFEEIVKTVEEFIGNMTTRFVLEDLSVLYKNGRLSRVAYVATSILDIVALLAGKDGEIVKVGQARGIKRALKTFENVVVEEIISKGAKKAIITHSACLERAEGLKCAILEKVKDIEIKVVAAGGLVSMYAAERGLVISY